MFPTCTSLCFKSLHNDISILRRSIHETHCNHIQPLFYHQTEYSLPIFHCQQIFLLKLIQTHAHINPSDLINRTLLTLKLQRPTPTITTPGQSFILLSPDEIEFLYEIISISLENVLTGPSI